MPSLPLSFDAPLGRKIIELHVWAVGEGLRGADAAMLFDGLCQRLVGAGVPLWRAFAGMPTLHPQWGGYGYTWWRRVNAIQPAQFERGDEYEQELLNSPFGHLMRQAETSAETGDPWLHLRRRLVGPEAQLDFPISTGCRRRRHRLFRGGRQFRRRRRSFTWNRDRLFLYDRPAGGLPRG